MRKVSAIFAASIIWVACAIPSSAQFADQATLATSVAGTNTITATLPNVSSVADLVGMLVKVVPVNTNTGSATINFSGAGAETLYKPTAAGLVTLTGGELVAGQPALMMLIPGGNMVILSVTSTTVAASNLANSSLQFGVPVNLQLNASAGSNQLTIAVKGNNGSDPSATNPVLIPFRDTTIANGDPVIRSLQAALSFTIGSSNTMGCVNNLMCRLWVLAFDNGGTVQLCAFNALSGTSVAPINEGVLQTSQSGTSGGSSAQLYYCNASAVTNKAARILGYVEISEATAGTWATGPTYTQLFGPGIKKPGDTMQIIYGSLITATTNLQTTQTQTAITASITPTSAANSVQATCNCSMAVATASIGTLQLSRGTSPTLFGNVSIFGQTSGQNINTSMPVTGIDIPNSTSSVSYYAFGKCSTNNNCITNNNPGVQPSSQLILQEIMSSLEPANDGQPLRMVG